MRTTNEPGWMAWLRPEARNYRRMTMAGELGGWRRVDVRQWKRKRRTIFGTASLAVLLCLQDLPGRRYPAGGRLGTDIHHHLETSLLSVPLACG